MVMKFNTTKRVPPALAKLTQFAQPRNTSIPKKAKERDTDIILAVRSPDQRAMTDTIENNVTKITVKR